MQTVVRYWPAVVAGLYLAYVLAAGQTNEVPPAFAAFVAAVGLNRSAVAAHARLDRRFGH